MAEIVILCAAAVIMAYIYSKTAHPKLYAFINICAGASSLILAEVLSNHSLERVTVFNTALSVILGVPGTILHGLAGIMSGGAVQ